MSSSYQPQPNANAFFGNFSLSIVEKKPVKEYQCPCAVPNDQHRGMMDHQQGKAVATLEYS